MLAKEHLTIEAGVLPKIEKLVNGQDMSAYGAFPYGTVITLRALLPRALGIAAPVLRISLDEGEDRDIPFVFFAREGDRDIYLLELSTEALLEGNKRGLFFYEYLFLRSFDTLFSDSINNVDFSLSPASGNRFSLLIHDPNFETPAWFSGGTMYHVFVDRFCRGEGPVVKKESAVIDPDWENGIPQYAEKQGDALPNNVFFGGNLWGVAEKLDYLASLGVTVIYLSPVFEAYSNHRYDTANYETVDGLLGGDAALAALLEKAHKRGMRVILDGVFNHTGDDSIYFNRRGTYPTVGAYQSYKSPYADWFHFRRFPNEYESWWGIEIMPRLQHHNEKCRQYFTGEKGIAARWIQKGIDGWRLDVADELSDDFLNEFRTTVKKASENDGLIIGEVWENAVCKIAYGRRREYFRGGQLDSVMNYPFRNAVLSFLLYGDANGFYNTLTELYGSYPLTVSNSLMNLLGTHDTERFLTRLGQDPRAEGKSNAVLSTMRLSARRRAQAIERMKLAAALQFTVYGVPSVYYGDEAGLEGYHDPFCRMPFPWGGEDKELLSHYRALGKLRRAHKALADGSFAFVFHNAHSFAYVRKKEEDEVLVIANMDRAPLMYPLEGNWLDCLKKENVSGSVTLQQGGFAILTKQK